MSTMLLAANGVAAPSSGGCEGATVIQRLVSDRSVRTKIMSVVLAVALVAALVAGLAVSRLSAVYRTADELVTGSVDPVVQLAVVQVDVQMSRIQMRDVALAAEGAGTETAMKKVVTGDNTLDTDLAAYLGHAADVEVVRTFQATWQKWRTARDETLVPAARAKDYRAYVKAQKVTSPLSAQATSELQAVAKAEQVRATANARSAKQTYTSARTLIIVIVVVGLLIALMGALYVTGRVLGSLREVSGILDRVAGGDLTGRAQVTGRDELGGMAEALNRATTSMQETVAALATEAFGMASSAEELSTVTSQISAAAEETSSQAALVAEAAGNVSHNAQTVASGAEQMGASIQEIAKNTSQAAALGRDGTCAAEAGNTTVAQLGDSSAEISNVIKLITSIAEQTNLLALNATIEAARAGEAGKGFAVVASEVKDLAQETAKATDDISRRIGAIQTDSSSAADTIHQVAQILTQLGDYQTVIASAVEEQTSTTHEMGRSATEAATAADDIAANIASVAAAARSTSEGVTQAETAAGELARSSSQLQQLAARFHYQA
jgi:methyl-accepting chemotaxis protein